MKAKPGEDITPQGAIDTLIKPGALEGLDNEYLDHLIKAAQSAEEIKSVRAQYEDALGCQTGPTVLRYSKEHRRLIEDLRLEEGYKNAMETQEFFGFTRRGRRKPTLDQVLGVFTQELLEKAQGFQETTMITIPAGVSFDAMVTAISSHKTMSEKVEVRVDKLFKPCANQETANWQTYIVEGVKEEEAQSFDDLSKQLGQRIQAFFDHKKQNQVQGMDRLKYSQLLMQWLKEGSPVESQSITILDEDPALSKSRIPYVDYFQASKFIHFYWFLLKRKLFVPLFRRSVGGNVPGF